MSSESFPATYQRTAYVAVTRGKEQVQIFTDDRKELLKAVSRPDDPMSATELSESAPQKPDLRNRLMKRLAFARGLGVFAARNDSLQPGVARDRRRKEEWTMTDDKPTHQDRLQRNPPSGRAQPRYSQAKEPEAEGAEASCGAFGYLRGIRDSATSVEFRFRDGNSIVVPLRLAGNLAVQPFRGAAAEILRGPRLPRADPGQQPRQAAQRRRHQSHSRRPATASRALDPRDDAKRKSGKWGRRGRPSTASRWRSSSRMPPSRNGSGRRPRRSCGEEATYNPPRLNPLPPLGTGQGFCGLVLWPK